MSDTGALSWSDTSPVGQAEFRESDPIRIGYLVQQFPPEVGAGPARVSEMALRWRDFGAEVTVITGMPNRPQGRIHPEYRGRYFVEENWRGIRVLRSWLFASPRHGTRNTIINNTTFMVTAVLHALRRAGELDVLIASSPPFFVHIAGDVVRRACHVPLVLEVRDLWPDYIVEMGIFKGSLMPGLLLELERRLLSSASAVVAVTQDICSRVEGKGVDSARIRLIPNGVDPEWYYPAEELPPLPALRQTGSEFMVGYLGNFGAGQALEVVIEAAALLAREDPSIRVVMAGDGTQRAQIEKTIRALHPANLTVHPAIPKDRTRAFYNACGACLVPLAPLELFHDALPTKLLEIMACGIPVVAALEGHAARMVQDSSCGVVAEPGNPRSIADAIHQVRSWGEERRAAAGRRGRTHIREHYARDALSRQYYELLKAVSESGAKR